MKIIYCFLIALFFSTICLSQNAISTDTTIVKTIQKGESFELSFEFSPGSGYVWYLAGNDSAHINISLKEKKLKDGYGAKGGVYLYHYKYLAQDIGTFSLEYYYGRPWLNERLKRCSVSVIVK